MSKRPVNSVFDVALGNQVSRDPHSLKKWSRKLWRDLRIAHSVECGLETRIDTSPHRKPGYNNSFRPENRPKNVNIETRGLEARDSCDALGQWEPIKVLPGVRSFQTWKTISSPDVYCIRLRLDPRLTANNDDVASREVSQVPPSNGEIQSWLFREK
jgi:hypothetical protein